MAEFDESGTNMQIMKRGRNRVTKKQKSIIKTQRSCSEERENKSLWQISSMKDLNLTLKNTRSRSKGFICRPDLGYKPKKDQFVNILDNLVDSKCEVLSRQIWQKRHLTKKNNELKLIHKYAKNDL